MLKRRKINEDQIVNNMKRRADYYFDKYRSRMDALETMSPLSRIRPVEFYDIAAVGEQLEQFANYSRYMKEAGTIADLGIVPNIAMDVIAAAYGASIIPLVSTVQPMEEEQGTVYFRDIVATRTRGNVTEGQAVLRSDAAPDVWAQGYACEVVEDEEIGTTVNGDLTYSATLAKDPIRPRTVSINVSDSGVVLRGVDDGEGNILGVGIQGIITYSSGVIALTFLENPGAGLTITATYSTDYEIDGSIPKLNAVFATKPARAEIYTLGMDIGLFQMYALNKRFGSYAEEELMQDLTNAMTAEVGNRLIYKLGRAATGSPITWDPTPTQGVSWVEHKLEMNDKLAQVAGAIAKKAGRGAISVLICGLTMHSYISSLPNFVSKPIPNAVGPVVSGTLNGVPVVRALDIVADGTVIAIYKSGLLDAPVAYMPYMPLFVSGFQPHTDNILKKEGMAAVWAATPVLCANFIQKFNLI